MDSPFLLNLPFEMRLQIYEYLEPIDLLNLKKISRFIATESMHNSLWRRYLKIECQNTSHPKEAFLNNLSNIRERNLILHPIANILLEIYHQETSLERKVEQLCDKATVNYMYTRLILSYPKFWQLISNSLFGIQKIKIVLKLFPENNVFILENKSLMQVLLQYRETIIWVRQVMEYYPEMGKIVLELLQDETLARKTLSFHDGFLLVKDIVRISSQTVQMFLMNTPLVTGFLKSSYVITHCIPNHHISKGINDDLGIIYLKQIILLFPENTRIFLSNEQLVLKCLESCNAIQYLQSIILSSPEATQQFLSNSKLTSGFINHSDGIECLRRIILSYLSITRELKEHSRNFLF